MLHEVACGAADVPGDVCCFVGERPNPMVKVPTTPAGIPAIRQLIGLGLNINVTLLFAVSVYEQVVEAYLAGLEDQNRSCNDLSKTGSVASIFVSRIDVAIDKRLDKLGDGRTRLCPDSKSPRG